MEDLIQLVAQSFIRHGLESEPVAGPLVREPHLQLSESPLPETLPEHNYRADSKAADPAP